MINKDHVEAYAGTFVDAEQTGSSPRRSRVMLVSELR